MSQFTQLALTACSAAACAEYPKQGTRSFKLNGLVSSGTEQKISFRLGYNSSLGALALSIT